MSDTKPKFSEGRSTSARATGRHTLPSIPVKRERAINWAESLRENWLQEARVENLDSVEKRAARMDKSGMLELGHAGSRILASAGELSEIALNDLEAARRDYSAALEYSVPKQEVVPDPRAYAGLRRCVRAQGDAAMTAALWQKQAKHKQSELLEQVLASIGYVRDRLQDGQAEVSELIEALIHYEPFLERLPDDVTGLFYATLDDLYIVAGDFQAAYRVRQDRLADGLGGDDVDATEALRMAVLAHYSSADAAIERGWIDASFRAAPSLTSLQPLLRKAYEDRDVERAVELLEELAKASDSPIVKARVYYELGVQYAWHFNDLTRARACLAESAKLHPQSYGFSSLSYMGLSRQIGGGRTEDEDPKRLAAMHSYVLDDEEQIELSIALGWHHYKSENFDEAVRLAESALELREHDRGALHLLRAAISRNHDWHGLISHLERALKATTAAELRIDLHVELAELYVELIRLSSARGLDTRRYTERVKRHLQNWIELAPDRRAIQVLANVLEAEESWLELSELYLQVARVERRAQEPEQSIRFYELAASVQEYKIRDPERTLEIWQEVATIDPKYIKAHDKLISLYKRAGRYDELLAHCEVYLASFEGRPRTQVEILYLCAHTCLSEASLKSRAEGYLVRALAIDPNHHSSLLLMERILRSRRDWETLDRVLSSRLDSLIDSHDRERAAASSEGGPELEEHHLELKLELAQIRTLYSDDVDEIERDYKLLQGYLSFQSRALLALDRLYESNKNYEGVARVLRQRVPTDSHQSRGSQALRYAELMEFAIERPAEAFSAWIGALQSPTTVLSGVAGLDRLWANPDVTRDQKRQAITAMADVEERALEIQVRTAALDLLIARGPSVGLDDQVLDDYIRTRGKLEPGDVLYAEHRALRLLSGADGEERASDWSGLLDSSALRVDAGTGDADVLTHCLDVITASDSRLQLNKEEIPYEGWERVANWLARESGSDWADPDTLFAGERALWGKIATASLVPDELLSSNDRREQPQEALARVALACALETGGHSDISKLRRDVIESLLEPERQLHFALRILNGHWLDDTQRVTWLTQIVKEMGLYDHPLRSELYKTLDKYQQWGLLAEAIANHEEHLGYYDRVHADPDILKLQAKAFKRLGNQEDAIEVLERLTLEFATDIDAVMELTMLLEDSGKKSKAIAKIRLLIEAIEPADRLKPNLAPVYERQADLELMSQGEAGDVAAALRLAWEASGKERTLGKRLGSQYAKMFLAEGADPLSPYAKLADEVFEASLDELPRPEDREYVLLYSAVLSEGLNKSDKAVNQLLNLMVQSPGDRALFKVLAKHSADLGLAQLFASELAKHLRDLAIEASDSVKGWLWVQIAELLTDELAPAASRVSAYEHARSHLGDSSDLLFKEAMAAFSEHDLRPKAKLRFLEFLSCSDSTAEGWRTSLNRLEEIARGEGDDRALSSAAAVAFALDEDADSILEPMPWAPQSNQRLNYQWQRHCSDLLSKEQLELVAVINSAAPRIFRVGDDSFAGAKPLSREANSHSFVSLINGYCATLGVQPPRLLSTADLGSPQVLSNGVVVLPEPLLETEATAMLNFWAARLAAMTQLQAWMSLFLDDVNSRQLLRALSIAGGGENYWSDLDDSLLKQVQNFRNRFYFREEKETCKRNASHIDRLPADLPRRLNEVADRFAMAVCNSPALAVREVMAAEHIELTTDSDPDKILATPRSRRLLGFALSRSYQELVSGLRSGANFREQRPTSSGPFAALTGLGRS